MELKVSSPKPGLSTSDYVSDPEEKEISEEDDDDRNHKHRRRETRSQSSETETFRPYRKRNKPFENGHSYRDGDSQSSETWKNYNTMAGDKDQSGRFDKRRGVSSFSRVPLDANLRARANQSLLGDIGPRGRGRETGSWNQRDFRFSSVDIGPHLVQHGVAPPTLFPGRGVTSVSNTQPASWSPFGLVPGLPNGGLETLHPLSLQGTIRTPLNPAISMGIPRQRCRDFEERGFCLRGDMCPMEHGVNRIVVEDVQSLSQLNLPVPLSSGPLLGTSAGQGSLPAVSAPSNTLVNSKSLHGRSSKPGITDDKFTLNGALLGVSAPGGADLYDPDQPLWINDGSGTSAALLALNSSNPDEMDSLLDMDPAHHDQGGLSEGCDNERPIRISGAASGSQNSSVWGRIGSSKRKLEAKEKLDASLNSTVQENETERVMELRSTQDAGRQGKRWNVDSDLQAVESSETSQNESIRIARKPSQKALRTVFVNNIPQKDNKRETLLTHFQKFGEVIDVYIPLNSQRAFVQFSKREEAEAALKAPDAVMGNRFIKLWWANRDSIPDDGSSGGNNVPLTPLVMPASTSPRPLVAYKGKDNLQSAGQKSNLLHVSVAPLPAADFPRPLVASSPKPPPPIQKKLENLELLKEELRKKQEILDQKRNEFRRQLDKLEKQATSHKEEVAPDQASKRQKAGAVSDPAKVERSESLDPGTVVSSAQTEALLGSKRLTDNSAFSSSQATSNDVIAEISSSKPAIRPLAPVGAPFILNRFKLDNRPTAFRIIPPLPSGLTNVSVLKEHFSNYGDLCSVEPESPDAPDGENGSEEAKVSVRVSFATRRAAERAFLNGKCCQGHTLQFMWLTPSSTGKDAGMKESPVATSKQLSDAHLKPSGEDVPISLATAATSLNGETDKRESETGGENLDEGSRSTLATSSDKA